MIAAPASRPSAAESPRPGDRAFDAIRRFHRSEDATTSVEYAVMLALILATIFGTIGAVGGTAGGLFGNAKVELDAAGF